MTFEPTWSQPLVDWQQNGSFFEPATPPIDGPDGGDLIQLPCINVDWLPLVLGALDQLRNPSSWLASLTDAGREEAIARADRLRQMVALSLPVPCVNPVVSLAFDCVDGLVATLADGSNVPVTGWMDNFCSCVNGCIAPVVPVQPPGKTPAELACNMAAWLAQTVLQQVVSTLAGAKAAGEDVNKWINDFASTFAAASFALEAVYNEMRDAFVTAIAFPLTDLENIRDDTTWWAEVKCCFYAAFLDTPGTYVTPANLDVIANCVGFTPYPAHPWVPTMIGNLIHNLGINFWRAVQQGGALTDADCSDCSTWCRTLDFRAGPQTYSPVVGGTWIAGVGWRGTFVPPDGAMSVHIAQSAWPSTGTLTSIDITWGADGSTGATNPELSRDMAVFVGASLQRAVTITPNTAFTLATQRYTFAATSANNVSIVIGQNSSGSGVVVIQDITFRGTGPNPFGSNNCT